MRVALRAAIAQDHARVRMRDATMSESPKTFDTGVRRVDLDPEHPLPLETPWGSFALFAVGAETFAVQSFCPHLEGPLFQGSVSGECVTCPWHGWRFSLRTGRRLDFAELFSFERDTLLVLEVRMSERGTIVLCDPGRRPSSHLDDVERI